MVKLLLNVGSFINREGYGLKFVNPRLFRYYPCPSYTFTFWWRERDGSEHSVELNRRFLTDGATIPRLFWFIYGLCPLDWFLAAMVHDWLWEQMRLKTPGTPGYFRSAMILRIAIQAEGWYTWFSWFIWFFVIAFGWVVWYFLHPTGTIRNEEAAFNYRSLGCDNPLHPRSTS